MATTQLESTGTITLPASGDLSSSQYCFVALASDGEVEICDTSGEASLGVLTNKPSAAGYAALVQVSGVAIVKFGGTVSPGGQVMTDTSGRAVAHSGANKVLGTYVGSANVASGEWGSVLLQGSDGTPGGGLESVSAAGAVSPTVYETHLTVSGTVAYTMGDGSYAGQRKRITCIAADTTPLGTVTLNGAQAAYGSEPTAHVFTAAGQAIEFEWTATGWKIIDFRPAGVETVAAAGTANPLCLVHQVAIDGTDDWILPDGYVPGQRSIWQALSAANIPVGTVSGLFYDDSDGSADGTNVNMDAAGDLAVLEWVGARWLATTLVSATVS